MCLTSPWRDSQYVCLHYHNKQVSGALYCMPHSHSITGHEVLRISLIIIYDHCHLGGPWWTKLSPPFCLPSQKLRRHPFSAVLLIVNDSRCSLNFCLPHPFLEAWSRPSLFPSEMLDILKQSSFLKSPHQAGPACASKLKANSSNHDAWRFFHFHTRKSFPRFSHWANSSSLQLHISQLGKILNLNTGHTLYSWHQVLGRKSDRIWVLWRYLIPNPSDTEQEKQSQCVCYMTADTMLLVHQNSPSRASDSEN